MKRNVFLIIALFLLAGCAAPNKFQSYEYKGGQEYPYVSVLVNDGHVHQSTSCGQYGCSTYVDHSHLFILNSLRQSGKFKRVDINNGLAQHKLVVRFERKSLGNPSGDFGKLMLGAVTLFMLPMPYDYRYEARLSLMSGNDVLKEYQYRRDSNELAFLFIRAQSAKENAIKSIVDNFLHDLESDGLLAGTPVAGGSATSL